MKYLKVNHENPLPYLGVQELSCPYEKCDLTFDNLNSLKEHIGAEHTKPTQPTTPLNYVIFLEDGTGRITCSEFDTCEEYFDDFDENSHHCEHYQQDHQHCVHQGALSSLTLLGLQPS